MPVTDDIVQSYRAPRVVLRRFLAQGQSEAFAATLLLVGLIVAFIAQWPVLSRASYLASNAPLPPLLLGAALGLLAAVPVFYLVAALSHLVLRMIGGQGSWYGARLALFFAFLAVSPLLLLLGLTAGFIGQGLQTQVLGVLVLSAFLYLWIFMLTEAERGWS